ncbi:MAG: bifunctional adenosylcobinamide kinase/adenosylcobinamide-phosphate guanylyltransferase [Alphaproteobacteria bacterium]|jgi:adenosylcobinamide kinase/adenosylcobinamide-phosphate guanylyltransferase|nr:bifunctional adenosylcobinamide kinase/adenosylcobinamide-phosphate guanylyltransferase [Alphaproteobacteria bacterium]
MPSAQVLAPVTLILGGARSGKSRYAESLVESQPGAWIYVATAEPGDDEMAARIRAHQVRRGNRWTTIEAPLDLAGALRRAASAEGAVLVDCLTLWLSNLIAAGHDIEAETAGLTAVLSELAGPVVLVSNEVGLGIVPDNPLARRFRDQAGLLHQAIAAVAPSVVWVAAGLPLHLKSQAA